MEKIDWELIEKEIKRVLYYPFITKDKIYCLIEEDLFSATDLENILGKTKQYWDKLMSTDKLGSNQTSAGKITTSSQLVKYLSNLKQ